MRAVLFPGQGSGFVESLVSWRNASGIVRELLEHAASCLHRDLDDLLVHGGRPLDDPAVLQPVLTSLTLGIYGELLTHGLAAERTAGHSLGEVAALAAAGVLTAEDAVELAATRGRLMADSAEAHPGGMVVLVGSDSGAVEEALALGREHGVLDLAAHNAPGEWVLSGDRAAIAAVLAVHPGRPLDVAGPWHASTMAPAAEAFHTALAGRSLAAPRIGLIGNRNGIRITDPATIPDLVAGQLTSPVAWTAVMTTLARDGVTEYVIPGPGKVLRGLVRANLDRDVPVRIVQYPETLDNREEVGRP